MSFSTLSELPPPPSDKTSWPWTEASLKLTDQMPDGNHWPLVSIVTPSYNQGQYIEETIRSVLLQGYPNLEYIIIDGGSTDNSVEIIRKYEPWLAYWVSEPDNGQSDAINKGWSISQGDILAWLNSDDMYTQNTIQTAVSTLQRHPEMAMIYGDTNVINELSNIIGSIISKQLNLKLILSMDRMIPQETTFIRRRALDHIGFLDTNLTYAMDYDLWVRIAQEFDILHIRETLGNFRVYSDTKSVGNSDKWLPETITILDRSFEHVNFGEETERIRSFAYGRLFWRRGISTYAQGDSEKGKLFCCKALEIPYWIDEDISRAINPLVYGEKDIREFHRKEFILKILGDIPDTIKEDYDLEKLVWQEYYASRVFNFHHRGNRLNVLKSFMETLFNQPETLYNRGILSITIESIVGQKIANVLRRIS